MGGGGQGPGREGEGGGALFLGGDDGDASGDAGNTVTGMPLNISVYIPSIFRLYSVYIQSMFSLCSV